jgi:hypothetical protein
VRGARLHQGRSAKLAAAGEGPEEAREEVEQGMTDFFRFPRTPHVAWLGEGAPRDDKLLSDAEVAELLSHTLVVEEKVDGANIGFSADETGQLRVQSRGKYLRLDSLALQFKALPRWLGEHARQIVGALPTGSILFGEWCYAVHSVVYQRLPDWFLAFDLYDASAGRFWSVTRRDRLVAEMGLSSVPHLATRKRTLSELEAMLDEPSRLTEGPIEGVYVRHDEGPYLVARAKLVRPEFVQNIDEHWSRRPLQKNELRPLR